MATVASGNGCCGIVVRQPAADDEPSWCRYASILRQCGNGSSKACKLGQRVHDQMVKSGRDEDTFLGNLVVQMYGKCGSIEDARAAFDRIRRKNRISWTILIAAYVQNGYSREALHLFQRMDLEGVKPDEITFISVIGGCSSLGATALTEGKTIHSRIAMSGFGCSGAVNNSLVHMYGKCGSLDEARNVFDRGNRQDVVSWNAMITAYAQHGYRKEALHLYTAMELEGIKPDEITFASVLSACSASEDLALGRMLHARFVASEFGSDEVVANCLISMYGNCGSLEDARVTFESMQCGDVFSWTSLIAAYAQHGHSESALAMLKRMDLEGVKPNQITFVSTLDACSSLGALSEGKQIHGRIVVSGFESETVIGNSLVNMYGKCRSRIDARAVFDAMRFRNVVTWSAVIASYSQCEASKEALGLFQQMILEGLRPNSVTITSVLDACSGHGALAAGVAVHSFITLGGLELDAAVNTALVNMYSKCGSLHNARGIFSKLQQQSDVHFWSSMIAAYAQQGHGEEALELYQRMDLEGIRPDEIIFASVLQACRRVSEVRTIHSRLVASGLELKLAVANSLVTAYGKCRCLDEAKRVFTRIPRTNVVSWSAFIATYAQFGDAREAREALHLYQEMNLEGIKPNAVTFVSLLAACAASAALAEGKAIHGLIISGSPYESHTTVLNSIVNTYGKCGRLEDASRTFLGIQCKDGVSWNTIVAAYGKHGYVKDAVQLSQQMQAEGFSPNDITFTSILHGCSHSGSIDVARGCFHAMKGDHGMIATAEHYRCLIDLLGRAGRLNDAEELSNAMPSQPDEVALESLLSACKVHRDLDRAGRIAESVLKLKLTDAAPYVSLFNIYATAGDCWPGYSAKCPPCYR